MLFYAPTTVIFHLLHSHFKAYSIYFRVSMLNLKRQEKVNKRFPFRSDVVDQTHKFEVKISLRTGATKLTNTRTQKSP